MNLKEATEGEAVIVTGIREGSNTMRLNELGVIEGGRIVPLFKSISRGIRAYEVKGCVIAIRDSDAKRINVNRVSE